MNYRMMLLASAMAPMSIQVDGTGAVTQAGDATEFGNGTDPVVKAAPTQASVAVEQGTSGRPAHWPTDNGEDGEFAVKSEADMEGWYAKAMEAAQHPADPKGEAPEAKTSEEPAPKAEAAKETPKGAEAEDKPAALTDDQIRENLKTAGGIYADPKYEPFAIEVERTGALSEESVAKAAEAFGVPAEYVKTFVQGQLDSKALAASKAATEATTKEQANVLRVNTAILSVIPDPAHYEAMMKWGASADSTISKDVQLAYDKALAAHDEVTLKALLPGIKAAYEATGEGPARRDITQRRDVQARTTPDPNAAKPYTAQAQMTKDMGDRRYATDPEFRAQVNARVAVSTFGNQR